MLLHSYGLWTLWRARLKLHLSQEHLTIQQVWDLFLASIGLHFKALHLKASREGPGSVEKFLDFWSLRNLTLADTHTLHFIWN